MSTKNKNLSEYNPADIPNGRDMRVGVVVSEWNQNITSSLLKGCMETLQEHEVSEDNIILIHVPGTYELTSGANLLLSNEKMDGIICLGCVVKGETRHDEFINHAVAGGLTNLSIKSNRPIIFGVLTTENMAQAVDRAGGKHGNKGIEAAVTALKMIALHKKYAGSNNRIGFKG